MNTFAVLCHPCEDSYCAHLFQTLTADLSRRHDVKTLDLYQGCDLPDVDPAPDLLEWAEALVLVYPTWWSSLPAPLLAWIELQLAAGAFDSLQRIVAVTTHGSGRLVNLVEGRVGRRMVLGGLRRSAQPGARARFVALYGVDRSDRRKLTRFAETAGARVAAALG